MRLWRRARPRRSQISTSAKDGSYKLIAMATGRYRIYYYLCRNRGNYLQQTRSLTVRTGQNITRFNAILRPGAIVSGIVTDTHGKPVRGICVQAQKFGVLWRALPPGADGTNLIDALPVRVPIPCSSLVAAGTQGSTLNRVSTRTRRMARRAMPYR